MSIQKVREYFKQFGIEDRIREFDVSSATVELAALAVSAAMLLTKDKVFHYRKV